MGNTGPGFETELRVGSVEEGFMSSSLARVSIWCLSGTPQAHSES